MTDIRVGERERERASQAWAGAPREAQMPVRVDGGVPSGTGAASPGAPGVRASSSEPAAAPSLLARWGNRALRVLRDAAIGVAFVAMVPIGLTAVFGTQQSGSWLQPSYVNTVAVMRVVERSRPFAIARDPSVNPMQAGLALAALSPDVRPSKGFPYRPVVERYARPWTNAKVPAAFASGRGSSWNGPASNSVLKTVAKGVSAADVEYLRKIAVAPLWPTFDLAARAPTVDVVGGRFELPFRPDARIYNMPIWRYAATKELAYASVSRAAYYLAIGQRAEAEAVLRRTIGFGFIFIDNATNLIDALIGRVIVDIGRAGLQDLYQVTNDPRLADVYRADPAQEVVRRNTPMPVMTPGEVRQMQLNNATSAVLPRAVRLENLLLLSNSVCTNPRELVLGPARDVRDAYSKANKDLARFPSERATLDLMLKSPSLPVEPTPEGGVTARVVIGASTIASLIFDNPRFAYCARAIAGNWP